MKTNEIQTPDPARTGVPSQHRSVRFLMCLAMFNTMYIHL